LRTIRALVAAGSHMLIANAAPAMAATAAPAQIPVTMSPSLGEHQSGRLIVFAKPLADPAKLDAMVTFDPFTPSAVWIAARDVGDLGAGKTVLVDGEIDSFPVPFSTLAPGLYELQAVLDRDHDYNYTYGARSGDIASKVLTARLPGPIPELTLDRTVAAPDELTAVMRNVPAGNRPLVTKWLPALKAIEFQSARMTAFRGTPTFIRGWVALPPGYDGRRRFPTVYVDGGFFSTLASARANAAAMMGSMASGDAPPMIWVYLDHSTATGTHEFADSANNGPWGSALTHELVPWLETQYAMDARASGRFLTGHSSGGWSALWLQVRYPKVFGGSWPTSPDPSDFHEFFNVDIYGPGANFYRDSAGKPFPFARGHEMVIATNEEFSRSEWAMGSYGGQMGSFEWVFSPRGADGRPVPLFDRATGAIDPAVAAYWRDNYDISNIIRRDWPALRHDLDGKLHLTVGGADTFYLDAPARRLEAAMREVGAKTDFRYQPGKTHFDLYTRNGDRMALLKDIAWEMYKTARPRSKRPESIAPRAATSSVEPTQLAMSRNHE